MTLPELLLGLGNVNTIEVSIPVVREMKKYLEDQVKTLETDISKLKSELEILSGILDEIKSKLDNS
jgi:phage shock protein A